ncbi:Ig domain-containing protein [Budviciaceae bacterium CWB-B4]|uniref:Ig domain-containing protein n=1 Tax=Limnobaculum xujianqingii TaxID=2738837 RepID=A0A9D7AKT9_9GAMM|nr:Ig-like domain-containing protein [Limnobaculum xujianqingii]MBK5074599.1 Ig domain-containing protein [Limnobaculum xujianqingii]MBK5177735.1 Ig domain-containing protein [Limnobaculum xujianqingii]
MALCQDDFGKLVGRVAVLRMAFGCPDTVPQAADWVRLGALTTKAIDYSMNTISSDADDSKGLVENVVTNMDLTISGEGEWRKRAKVTEIGPVKMSKYIFTEVQAQRQPGLWVRFDFLGADEGTYIQGYFNATSWSSDFGSSDFATYSGEWKVADADSVTFVDGSDIPVASVTVTPATSTGAAASTVQLTANVLPADATDKTGVWTTSDATKATVSSTGLVTRVATGSATITFTTNDGAKTATSAITITA